MRAKSPAFFTQLLPGYLGHSLGTAVLLAFPLSFLLLLLYRRAVLKSMDRRAAAAGDLPRVEEAPATPSLKPSAPLQIITKQETDAFPLTPAAQRIYNRAVGAPWRAAVVYALGGAVFAAIMAIAWFFSTRTHISPLRFLGLSLIYGWPLLLGLILVVIARVRTRLLLVLAYFCLYGILGVIAVALSPKLSFTQLFVLWVIPNAPPTAFVLASLSRRVRAVGPLVLTVLLLASMGAVFSSQIIESLDLYWRRIISLPSNLSFDSQVFASLNLPGSLVFSVIEWPLLREVMETFFLLALAVPDYARFYSLRHLMGFAVFGALGWLLVQWIKAQYERKKISDQSLTLDSLWLLFGVVYSSMLLFADRGPQWALAGLVAFLAYKLVVTVGFRAASGPPGGQGVRLLLLRVFALGKRSERLFNAFGARWRYLGPMQLIAGPDLATTTIEPHEFLEFLTGKLGRRFIDGPETLKGRLAEMDLKPDRDWRFRVNDFFCFADTWKMVLERLVSESDAVLMDLRSFSRERAGCIFEITEIINSVSLDRAVFLVDATTDEPFLRQTIEQAWSHLRPSSPNYDSPAPQLCLFHYSGPKSLDQLLRAVCAAAGPQVSAHFRVT